MKLVRSIVSLAVLVLSACGVRSPSGAPEASAAHGATGRCQGKDSVEFHDAPALEATLPTRVGGRDLATWSVAGRCWLEISIDDDAVIEEILADTDDPSALDLSHLAQAVAGRRDTSADPPYFVFAANRPESDDEINLTLLLLFGGAGFRDIESGVDLNDYEAASIGGKEVHVGSIEMVRQNDHQRGRPYVYQTDDTMFLVLTDDDAWA